MNERLNWMLPSVNAGRLFSTQIQLSWWLIIVPLVVCPKYGLALGLTFSGLLYISILLHEFAHVFTARWTGGSADEIHLTPVGGLAQVSPARGAFGMGITAAAGPALNLFLCLLTFPRWYAPETLWGSLNPLVLPVDRLNPATLWHDLALLLFIANWIGFLINLLPVLPLDGGQILRAGLLTRVVPELVNRTAINVGIFVGVMILVIGAAFDLSQILLIGTFVLLMNVVQFFQMEMGESLDESAYSFDFAAEDDSLERSNSTATRESVRGPISRWRERRRLQREQLERIRRTEVEQQLDSLLAKVHEHGLQSLSEQEKISLKTCSEHLRDRGKNEN